MNTIFLDAKGTLYVCGWSNSRKDICLYKYDNSKMDRIINNVYSILRVDNSYIFYTIIINGKYVIKQYDLLKNISQKVNFTGNGDLDDIDGIIQCKPFVVADFDGYSSIIDLYTGNVTKIANQTSTVYDISAITFDGNRIVIYPYEAHKTYLYDFIDNKTFLLPSPIGTDTVIIGNNAISLDENRIDIVDINTGAIKNEQQIIEGAKLRFNYSVEMIAYWKYYNGELYICSQEPLKYDEDGDILEVKPILFRISPTDYKHEILWKMDSFQNNSKDIQFDISGGYIWLYTHYISDRDNYQLINKIPLN
jgi:hypothetical protein